MPRENIAPINTHLGGSGNTYRTVSKALLWDMLVARVAADKGFDVDDYDTDNPEDPERGWGVRQEAEVVRYITDVLTATAKQRGARKPACPRTFTAKLACSKDPAVADAAAKELHYWVPRESQK